MIYEISGFGYNALIETETATLIKLQKHDLEIIHQFPKEFSDSLYAGKLLAPWPNRIKNGTYHFEKKDYIVEINDKITNSALHGLMSSTNWEVNQNQKDRITLFCNLNASEGYPFILKMEMNYTLTNSGLKITITTTNLSDENCPYGVGFHPYFSLGDVKTVNSICLKIPTEQVYDSLSDSILSINANNSAKNFYKFRKGSRIDNDHINQAFKINSIDKDTEIYSSLNHKKYLRPLRGVNWVHVYTLDYAPGNISRKAIALEPMSCPPNSFNNKIDLLCISPRSSHTFSFILGADKVL